MKLARIAGQVTSAFGTITTGAGIKVIEHAPLVAPFVLILRATIAIINSISWAVDTLAGGEDNVRKEKSILLKYFRENFDAMVTGRAKASDALSFKGALLSTFASILTFALLFTPAGAATATVILGCQLMFIASSAYWYRSVQAERKEKLAGIKNHDTNVDAAMLREINKESFFNKSAAAISLSIIVVAAVLSVGIHMSVIVGVLTLACAFCMYCGHVSAQKQKAMLKDCEMTEFSSSKPNEAAAPRPSLEQSTKPGLVMFSGKENREVPAVEMPERSFYPSLR